MAKTYYIYKKAGEKLTLLAECKDTGDGICVYPQNGIPMDSNELRNREYQLWKYLVSENQNREPNAKPLRIRQVEAGSYLGGIRELRSKLIKFFEPLLSYYDLSLFPADGQYQFSDEIFVKIDGDSIAPATEKQEDTDAPELFVQKISRMEWDLNAKAWKTSSSVWIGKEQQQDDLYREFTRDDNHCMLLTGEGGIGKTHTMRLLCAAAKLNQPGLVYAINLPHLLLFSAANPIAVNQLAGNAVTGGGENHNGYSSYIAQYLRLDTMPEQNGFFLLDGLNELEDMTTNQNAALVNRLYHEITDICKARQYHVVLSSRLLQTASNRIPDVLFTVYQPQALEVDLSELRFSQDTSEADREKIKSMMRLPLFYQLYQKLFQNSADMIPATRYALMRTMFSKLYQQSATEKGLDTFAGRSLYFLLMPLIAHKMHMKRAQVFHSDELADLIEALNDGGHTTAINTWVNACAEKEGISLRMPNVEPLLARDAAIQEMVNSGLMVSHKDTCTLEFSHQVWRDFLGSYYVLNYLEMQKQSFEAGETISGAIASDILMPSFNLPSLVQDQIREQSKLYSAKNEPQNETPEAKEERLRVNAERGDAFLTYFAIPDTKERDSIRQMQNTMTRLYTAYELYDHFMLHHYDAMKKLAGDFFQNHILHQAKQNTNLKKVFKDETLRLRYCKSLAALMECARRSGDFEMVYEIHEIAMNSFGMQEYQDSPFGEEMLTYRILQHQYAKAKLFESREMLARGEGGEQFCDAVQLLKENGSFNMSASLLGCMYATPNAFLLAYTEIRQNFVQAAEVYQKAFAAMTSGSLVPLTGTELLYIGRQYVNLMMKGYVRCQKQEDGTLLWFANDEPALPDSDTLEQTKFVLDHLEGQKNAFLNWDRAMYRLYAVYQNCTGTDAGRKIGMLYEAAELLLTESKNIMTMAVRLANLPAPVYWKKGEKIYDGDNREIEIETEDQQAENEQENEQKTDQKKKTVSKAERMMQQLEEEIGKNIKEIGKAGAFDATDSFYYLQDLVWLCGVLEKFACAFPEKPIKTEPIQKIRNALDAVMQKGMPVK